jgi:predicted nuclease of predicted toxin-antitoxin system
VRVLLDNDVDQRFGRLLSGHEVIHARNLGWAELLNGELIAASEAANFNVLITADKNMRYQQNVTGRKIGIMVLNPPFNRWPQVEPLAAQVQGLLDTGIQPGIFTLVNP